MKKINVENFLFTTSLVFYLLVNILMEIIINYFGSFATLGLLLTSNFFILILILKKGKIKLKNTGFCIAYLMMFLPSLYKNAYLQDHIYAQFLYYFFTILYVVLISFLDFDEKKIGVVFKSFIIFAIITSVISWLSIVFPDKYLSLIIEIMPKHLKQEIYRDFLYYNNRMGLTSHYSRNAFYILLGIICNLYNIINPMKKRDNKYLIVEIFLIGTMLMVGKRGHILFLIISSIFGYFIYKRVSVSTIIKFVFYLVLGIILLFIAVKFVPDISNAFERFFYNASDDYSNGRFKMYNNAYRLYKNNGGNPIGWGQYAKSTNYDHPALHNDYLQLYFEVGVLGFAMVILSNVYVLIKSIKKIRREKNNISIIIFIFNSFYLMYSMTGLPHYDTEVFMFYFLINIFLYNSSKAKGESEWILKEKSI